eukprot:5161469-Ditylum_brightwellii.AAC.1
MDEYAAMLEKWEQEIIDNTETLASLDKLIAFMQQGQCLIATDCSASNDMMSFMWKMVDINGNAYFCHAGPSFEHNKIENKMYTIVYLDNEGII